MIEQLPSDWRDAVLVGRILTRDGPTPVVVTQGRVRDVSGHAATVSQLLNSWNGNVPAGKDLGPLESLEFTREFAGAKDVRLLSALFVWKFVPESKGVSLEAMKKIWKKEPVTAA